MFAPLQSEFIDVRSYPRFISITVFSQTHTVLQYIATCPRVFFVLQPFTSFIYSKRSAKGQYITLFTSSCELSCLHSRCAQPYTIFYSLTSHASHTRHAHTYQQTYRNHGASGFCHRTCALLFHCSSFTPFNISLGCNPHALALFNMQQFIHFLPPPHLFSNHLPFTPLLSFLILT